MQGIFIERRAIRLLDKGDKFEKEPLPAHTEPFAKPLAGKVVILHIGVNPPGALVAEEIVQESLCRLKGVALALLSGGKHPAGADLIRDGILRGMGFSRLRQGLDFPDDGSALLKRDGQVELRLFPSPPHFSPGFIQGVELHGRKAPDGRLL